MMKKIVFIFVIFSIYFVSGTDYYISKNGNNQNGTSWTNAWNELNQINWEVINVGDRIIIDGGSSGMNYTSRMVIQQDNITITRTEDAEHDGIIGIIGGGFETDKNFIVIDGLNKDKFKIFGDGGYTIYAKSGTGNLALNNLYIWGEYEGSWGVFILVYTGNLMINNSEISGQSAKEDHIKFYSDGNLIIENSVFHGWKSIDGSHSDFLEGCNSGTQVSCPGGNVTVRRNIFHGSPHDCFMMSDTAFDNVEFSYNIFNNVSDAIKLYSANKISVNNNIFTDCRDLIVYQSSSPENCSNNIYVGESWSGSAVSLCSNIDHSIWDINSPGFISGSGNMQVDPMFIDKNSILGLDGIAFTEDDGYNILSGSPAIDNGKYVGLQKDIRLQEIIGNPDIGAYEYIPLETCNHPAEQGTPDCIISLNELTAYVNSWKSDLSISLVEVMEAINYWKAGGY